MSYLGSLLPWLERLGSLGLHTNGYKIFWGLQTLWVSLTSYIYRLPRKINIKSYTHWFTYNFKGIWGSLNLRGLVKHHLINFEQTFPAEKNLKRSALFQKMISENILLFMYSKFFFSHTPDIFIAYRGNCVALELSSTHKQRWRVAEVWWWRFLHSDQGPHI